jgi:hypothetical protein
MVQGGPVLLSDAPTEEPTARVLNGLTTAMLSGLIVSAGQVLPAPPTHVARMYAPPVVIAAYVPGSCASRLTDIVIVYVLPAGSTAANLLKYLSTLHATSGSSWALSGE